MASGTSESVEQKDSQPSVKESKGSSVRYYNLCSDKIIQSDTAKHSDYISLREIQQGNVTLSVVATKVQWSSSKYQYLKDCLNCIAFPTTKVLTPTQEFGLSVSWNTDSDRYYPTKFRSDIVCSRLKLCKIKVQTNISIFRGYIHINNLFTD